MTAHDAQETQDARDPVLDALAALHDQLDPVPEVVSQSARAVFELRDLDAELVPLVESMATTPVRGGEDSWLSFALDGLEIDLGSRRERHGWQLVGQVTGPVRELAVHTLAGTEPVALDAHGRFRAAVSARTLSLRLTTPDGRRLRTQWVSL
ncbi:hypothetical protein [Angustibacter sp. Root456]|uniref:hypothetical protein n=1 Tax=Angustibacter sp. Root456 TaxID=1736539 RepID=UPI0012FBA34F|nr:hypothetical protein [Angustibacter sp. Root456]